MLSKLSAPWLRLGVELDASSGWDAAPRDATTSAGSNDDIALMDRTA